MPSIIATLATLSILDGISLTLRPTAQGVISPDLATALTTKIGPIPVAFIVVVAGAILADVWLHASGSGLALRAVGFDERSAKRGGVRTNWIRVRALLFSAVLAAVASFFVMARSPIGNATGRLRVRAQQHHRRRPGGRVPGRGQDHVLRWDGGGDPPRAHPHRLALPRPVTERRADDHRHPGPDRDRPLPARRHQGAGEEELQAGQAC